MVNDVELPDCLACPVPGLSIAAFDLVSRYDLILNSFLQSSKQTFFCMNFFSEFINGLGKTLSNSFIVGFNSCFGKSLDNDLFHFFSKGIRKLFLHAPEAGCFVRSRIP